MERILLWLTAVVLLVLLGGCYPATYYYPHDYENIYNGPLDSEYEFTSTYYGAPSPYPYPYHFYFYYDFFPQYHHYYSDRPF